jgi:predicted helicase
MDNISHFNEYIKDLQKNLSTGASTEHTHRPTLKTLLEAIADGVLATNEPKRVECGAPDYILTRVKTPIGNVEAKDIGTNLDKEERSEQLARYRDGLHNLILTDYLEFRWYVWGEHRQTARLATVTRDGKIKRSKSGIEEVRDLLQKFFAEEVPTVGTPKELAQRMAALARMICNLIEETFKCESEEGALHTQLKAFREALIPELTPAQFADMYAQTIAYGLFAARLRVPTGQSFTREKAAWNLPKTNPLLRRLFNEIAGPDLDDRIAWQVDNLAYLLARADMAEVLRDFGKRTRQQDPVIHFYETFLTAYNPKERVKRGVYYTPEPVVSYIVRSIDYILKTRFNRPLGLADMKTFILDPAVGTATFLYFVIQQIHDTLMEMEQGGAWNEYVEKHLLPRIFGFELLMAPYAVAHMKLGIQLQETGYDFAGKQRLGIYLTNSLEEAIFKTEVTPFARYITEEANAAAEVKRDKPIMVVLGNPPYSVSSSNKNDHIEKLMDRYKTAVRGERNIQPLSDDYIKFIRFAHDRIERTGYGIIGMITNHSYLSGLIHRGMREELLKTFDEIYMLNLHGNALMRETAPDGGPDENVFDIRQGVAIALFVKKRESESSVKMKYADLWGLRKGKYRYLLENDISTIEWQELEPVPPYFFFVPKKLDFRAEYETGWSVPDIFPVASVAVGTYLDHFVIDFDEDLLRSRIDTFRDEALSNNEVEEKLKLRDSGSWSLSAARKAIQSDSAWGDKIHNHLYRPFDVRAIFYCADVVARPRHEVMRHMLNENLGLLTVRRIRTEIHQHFFITNLIADKSTISIRDNCIISPLYLYTTPEDTAGTFLATEEVTREPNLSSKFIATVKEKLSLDFVPDGKGDLKKTFGPEDILHYAYAVFHSPTYRERYAEFLKIDFPRLPLTSNLNLFKKLANKGEELIALHLMESPRLDKLITSFPETGSNEVEKVRYAEPRRTESGKAVPGRVFINKTQYFEGIDAEVWEFQIGGYQVLQKWLKDRKNRKLSFDDLMHYQKIVVALKRTMRLMRDIDDLIPSWPIE